MEIAVALIIVVLSIMGVIYMFLHQDKNRMEYAMREKMMNNVMPNRLQAYERLSLYLERINPDNMVVRELPKAVTAKDLHILMINSIRQEFEHNIAMQIYINPNTWDMVLDAKAAVAKCINDEAKNIDPKQPAAVLATGILGGKRNECNDDIRAALDCMRRDITGQFAKTKK